MRSCSFRMSFVDILRMPLLAPLVVVNRRDGLEDRCKLDRSHVDAAANHGAKSFVGGREGRQEGVFEEASMVLRSAAGSAAPIL